MSYLLKLHYHLLANGDRPVNIYSSYLRLFIVIYVYLVVLFLRLRLPPPPPLIYLSAQEPAIKQEQARTRAQGTLVRVSLSLDL